MKKSDLILIPALLFSLIIAGCSKSSTDNEPYYTPEGKWTGSSHNNIGGPVLYFAITLQAGTVFKVEANDATTPDLATGSWSLVGDSIKASYTFTGTSSSYSLAGKYSSRSNVMTGTIGVNSNSAGYGAFSVTKN